MKTNRNELIRRLLSGLTDSELENLVRVREEAHTKTLTKIQVRGIFRIRDIRRIFFPKLIEICMETPCNMADGNQQKHLLPRFATKG